MGIRTTSSASIASFDDALESHVNGNRSIDPSFRVSKIFIVGGSEGSGLVSQTSASRLGRIVDPKGLCVNLRVSAKVRDAGPDERQNGARRGHGVERERSSSDGDRVRVCPVVHGGGVRPPGVAFARDDRSREGRVGGRERVGWGVSSAGTGERR